MRPLRAGTAGKLAAPAVGVFRVTPQIPCESCAKCFLVVECAGSACFPGCYCGSTSGTECWSFGSHVSVVQDAVRVSHLLCLISCPSQWFPFEPELCINILYSSKSSTILKKKRNGKNNVAVVDYTKKMSNVLPEF